MEETRADLSDVQREILDGLRVIAVTGAILIVIMAVLSSVEQGGSVWAVIQCGGGLGLLLSTVRRFGYRARAAFVVVGTAVVAVAGQLHYGPLMGIGLLYALAALASAFFWDRRGTIAVVVSLVASLVAVAIAARLGLVHARIDLSAMQWARMALSVAVTLTASAYLLMRLQILTRRSLEAHAAALAERTALEVERERVLRTALASQRLESLGRLAGGVAHDFNNALLVILSGAELMRLPGTAEAERAKIVDEVEHAARAGAATARQLLTFSRGAPDSVGFSSPAAHVQRFASSVRRLLPENIRLEVVATGAGQVALAEPAIEQVLLNLVLNARDAMPGGGVLMLRCRDDGEHVRLEVEDDGAGMADEVRVRLFEPFFTTKGDRGTGLGLAMAWGTITRAGGTIEVDSAPGKGTRFHIALPRVAEPPRPARADSVPPPAVVAARRVLLLEDEPGPRSTMVRMLARGGFDVSGHATAGEARRALGSGRFSILITDAVVPGGGVPDLIAEFRSRNAGAPVLVCSGYVKEDIVLEGIRRDELTFLPKPFGSKELLAAIEAQLREPAARPRHASQPAEKIRDQAT